MRWRNAWLRHGADALKVRFSPGRPRRLTRRQEKRLVRILLRGALANGYRTEVWTTKRVAEVIEKTFHVRSEEHTSELQSLTNLVCRLLLEKKKKKNQNKNTPKKKH